VPHTREQAFGGCAVLHVGGRHDHAE
jgi:hypothetical protein